MTQDEAKECRRMLGSMSMHANAEKAWAVYNAVEAIANGEKFVVTREQLVKWAKTTAWATMEQRRATSAEIEAILTGDTGRG